MGKFRTSEFHRVEGVYAPVESVGDCTYCDKCGSFNIDIGYPKRAFDDPLAIEYYFLTWEQLSQGFGPEV